MPGKEQENQTTQLEQTAQQNQPDEVYNIEEYSGTAGLGNLKSGNYNQTPYSYLSKYDEDSRKIALDVSKFRTPNDYTKYFRKWLKNTDIIHIINETELCTNKCLTFEIEGNRNIIYTLYIAYNIMEIKDAIQMLSRIEYHQNVIHNKVIIGHINFSETFKKMAKDYNIELLGISQIHEINDSIDNALKGLPYLNISVNKLYNQLGRELHKKYSIGTKKDLKNITGDYISDTVTTQAKEVYDEVKESLIDGAQQLKSSFSNLIDKLTKPK